MSRNIIFIAFILFFSTFLIFYFSGHLEYLYEKHVLANRSTRLFSCDSFREESYLNTLLINNHSDNFRKLQEFLTVVDGNIGIIEVGKRCSNKYQYIIHFNSDKDRVEIERFLDKQTLFGIPVFLRNV